MGRGTLWERSDLEYLRLGGQNAMSGPLPLSGGTPLQGNHATDKNYVDAQGPVILAQAQVFVDQLQALLLAGGGVLDQRYTNRTELPGLYEREYDDTWGTAGVGAAVDRYTLTTPAGLTLDINGMVYFMRNTYNIDLSQAASWDAIAPDYTVAANRAGVDFYIYACVPAAGMAPVIVLSDNAVAPVGYTALTSRRVGGFHGLCVAAGAIGGHPLTNFAIGDILPDSIWDYKHRPLSEPEGMVFSAAAKLWVDIYFPSGIGAATASVYGAVISDTRDWNEFVDDGGAVNKRLLFDNEFQLIAAGSNEETNIAGGADPVTTGGHSDTVAQRMISNIGCEDCCGASWQWILDQSFQYGGGDHIHTNTITHKGIPTGSVVQKDLAENVLNGNLGSAADETTDTSSVDPAPVFAQFNLPGARGSINRQGTLGDVKLRAGGTWNGGPTAGSQARDCGGHRWWVTLSTTARFCSLPRR